jgi:3-hydroxyisobutyrate dehydrogenase-like beta-hydroxyacid dehydrogenase
VTTVGFIGLGTMGGPMARNVLKGGYSLIVFDVNAAAVDALVEAGASPAANARELAAASDIIVTMLPDVPEMEATVDSPDGVLAGLRPGGILVDMSTIDPETTRRIGAKIAAGGGAMIDSPVGKTAEHAVSGTLTLMVGGDPEVVERVRPMLKCMGSDLVHCGALGMGQAMKLTNNLLASVLIAANAEALVAGVKAGLTLETMLSVLKTTMAWNQQLAVAMQNRALKGDFDPGFRVRLALKDCRLAMGMNTALGLEAPLGAAAVATLRQAMDQGLAEADVGCVLKLREQAAGVEVRLPVDRKS